ncbi:MAG: transposase, partial [Proteobacteria bacterium]|nr:transposase [Pseudomonadota bacterium]
MANQISVAARQELVKAIGERYRAGSREEKFRILDEFVAVTGYHRKHSIRILNTIVLSAASRRCPRLRLYDQAVREALVVLWEASDRVCGKRLKPLLPLLVEALERHGHLRLDDVVRTKLHSASASTIDRLLAEPRGSAGRRHSGAKATPAIRRSIAVRT